MNTVPADGASLPHTPAAMAQGRFDSGARHAVRSDGEQSGRDSYRNQNQITPMKCPYCNTEIEAKSQTQREIGKIVDGECENGHKATVAWPDRVNDKIDAGQWSR